MIGPNNAHRSRLPARRQISLVVACIAAIGIVGLLPACRSSKQDSKIQVQLNWYPDAQFGGFYAAALQGEFAAEGLDVEIQSGGPDVTVLPKLAMNRVEFAIGNADQVLMARSEGADVVAVMASMQDSPRCIMVHEKSGIQSLHQLKHMTLAMGEGNPFAEFLKSKVPLEGVRIVAYSGSVAKFLVDESFAQQGYVFSEPIVARQRGSDPVALMVSELGFNPYTGLIITTRSMIQNQPEVVRKFVRATIRGWQHYLADPQKTNEEICRLNSEMDMDSLAKSVDVIRTLCVPPGSDIATVGQMIPQRWQTLAAQMQALEILPKQHQLDPNQAFTTDFLQSPLVPRRDSR